MRIFKKLADKKLFSCNAVVSAPRKPMVPHVYGSGQTIAYFSALKLVGSDSAPVSLTAASGWIHRHRYSRLRNKRSGPSSHI